MRHPIVDEELALLERIAATLAALPPRGREAELPLERELEQLREIYSEAKEEDAPALRQQMHRHTALLEQLRASRAAPQVDPRSPYFAHLRLREEDGERDLCLGRATCLEGGIRIVDWRNAPISRLFYRYRQGEEYEEELAGRSRSGEVVTRRTVGIRDGALDRIEAPEGVFTPDAEVPGGWRQRRRKAPRLAGGEASALRAHGVGQGAARRLGSHLDGRPTRADKRLPEITGLIDPAQFGLITRPGSGFLAIRGSAGSGKTTVALHRIAYLAFHDEEVDSDRTLFLTFSQALRSYVGHVLPALGIERVRIRTFHEWAAEQRRRHYPQLPASTRQDAPSWVQRMKLHPALGRALAEQVRRHEGAGDPAQALDDWASVLTHRALLEEVFASQAPGEIGSAEIGRFVEWCTRRNEELFAHLGGEPRSDAELDPEDDALLLRAWQLRVGPLRQRGRRPLRYRHVAIDEVQDFAPLEVQLLLGCLDRHRSITLAGDTQQHLSTHSGFTSWAEFLSGLGVPGSEIETLRVSYRSTAEIVAFAHRVLGGLAEEERPETTRSGPSVELFRFTDHGGCVAFLADALRDLAREEPLASVALLTPSRSSSDLYFRGLAQCELPSLRRVVQQDFTFSPGVEVTEIEQAKGLEFDYVILVDVTAEQFPDDPPARRRLHVGATRAVHQLWLTCLGTPSSVVEIRES